jgi:membrane-associated phospholipid phosphatase
LAKVPSICFDWEQQIPFLDWTIVPYMSIDLFYAVSLFICTTRAELDQHAKRLFCATVISLAGFLLFPLQCSAVRPATEGLNGALFAMLLGFDKPFNQAPSLHVSLLILLWVVYARHLRGVALWLLHGWFGLIGLSVFTTFQHHVIDGLAALPVAIACFYLFPDWVGAGAGTHAGAGPALNPDDRARSNRLARRYGAGALACCVLAVWLGGWGWLGLWPAAALGTVALAYGHFGSRVFQKQAGRQTVAAWLWLAPYRYAAWLSSRWFSRHDLPWVEVVPGILIGRAPGARDWQNFAPGAVLDLAAEFTGTRPALALPYRSVPLLDLVAPPAQALQQAVSALQALRQMAGSKPVLVHCALGYSRSALVVAAWLLASGQARSVAEATGQIARVRHKMVLHPASLRLLDAFLPQSTTEPD